MFETDSMGEYAQRKRGEKRDGVRGVRPGPSLKLYDE